MPTTNHIPTVLENNIRWHIEQIAVQVGHADRVKGRAKSGYYKVAILLAAAVVEALAHIILVRELNKGVALPKGPWECYESHSLPQSYQSGTQLLAICKRRQSIFKLTKKTDFAIVNKISYDLNIFSNAFFKRLEWIRATRNNIHLQGLDRIDRSYTKRQLDSVGYAIDKLIDKI